MRHFDNIGQVLLTLKLLFFKPFQKVSFNQPILYGDDTVPSPLITGVPGLSETAGRRP